MPDIDYTGPQGGLMGMAFAGGWAIASALWVMIGGVIWRFFIEPRIKQLEKDRADDAAEAKAQRQADQARCKEETDQLRDRIVQLETMLMLHGPQQLRQAMQAVASETHTAIHELRQEVKP